MLGCRLDPSGRASGTLRRRVALAAALYREGVAPLVLLSGGGAAARPEAEAMRELALAAGVPGSALLLEDRSRNTVENALHAARLLRQQGSCRIVLVSSRAHLRRAALLFRLAGCRIVGRAGAPARSWPGAVGFAIREGAALPASLARMLLRRRGQGRSRDGS